MELNTEDNSKSQSHLGTNDFVDCKETSSDRESSVESFHTNASRLSTATEADLIDVDDIELSDEESWLYKSPRKLSTTNGILAYFEKDMKKNNISELQETKDALLIQLGKLKNIDSKRNSSFERNKEYENCDKSHTNLGQFVLAAYNSSDNEMVLTPKNDIHLSKTSAVESVDSLKNKENEVLDLTDVQKMARIQEESLRESSSKFFVTGKKDFQNKGLFSMNDSIFSKPTSAEALNVCHTNQIDKNHGMNSSISMQKLPKQCFFDSSSLSKKDIHRGSLPNINPGYYSLKTRKSRMHDFLDSSSPFPLPIHPNTKYLTHGTELEMPVYPSRRMHTLEMGNCSTLPSSYRTHSKNNAARKNSSTPSPQCEYSSVFLATRNGSNPNLFRRDSAPSNPPRFVSPVSSPTLHQKCNVSSPTLFVKSPTIPNGKPPKNPSSPPEMCYRTVSPSRRLPFSNVHNRSPKRGNSPASPRKGEMKGVKPTTKISSPSNRSGIPVPSYFSKGNDEDTWRQDCF